MGKEHNMVDKDPDRLLTKRQGEEKKRKRQTER